MKKDLRVLQVSEMLHGAVGVAQWKKQDITGGSKSQSPIAARCKGIVTRPSSFRGLDFSLELHG